MPKKEIAEEVRGIIKRDSLAVFEGDAIIRMESMEDLFFELEQSGVTLFSLKRVQSTQNGEIWFQVAYFSRNLGRSIILMHDIDTEFNDLDVLVSFIEKTNREVTELEDRLPNLSADVTGK